MVAWFIPILVGLVLGVGSVLLMPRPKAPKPDGVRDLETPTAEAGRTVARVFGSMRVSSPNVLDTMDKGTHRYEIKA